MNDSSDSPERTDSPEPMPTQCEARSVSGADADSDGIRQTQREISPASQHSASPEPREPWDTASSDVDKIFTQHVDFL